MTRNKQSKRTGKRNRQRKSNRTTFFTLYLRGDVTGKALEFGYHAKYGGEYTTVKVSARNYREAKEIGRKIGELFYTFQEQTR